MFKKLFNSLFVNQQLKAELAVAHAQIETLKTNDLGGFGFNPHIVIARHKGMPADECWITVCQGNPHRFLRYEDSCDRVPYDWEFVAAKRGDCLEAIFSKFAHARLNDECHLFAVSPEEAKAFLLAN